MVFESIIVAILNKYIGKYVKNLDSHNLSIGLWSGKATLCDLELKDEALAAFELPIEVVSGYIGKMSLTIPWSSIYMEPVIIDIENVYVLTAPLKDSAYDEEKEKKFLNVLKQIQLKNIELRNQSAEISKETSNENDTLTEKLTAQIIKNMQVFINMLHVRYEDQTTGESPFAVGITLHRISAQTTNENWLPTVVDGSIRKIFKMVKLECISLYWNTNVALLMKANTNWKSRMQSQISTFGETHKSHEYLLQPFSFNIKTRIDQNAKITMEYPKFVADIILGKISLAVTKPQFECMVNLAESLEMMNISKEYLRYKPITTVKESPKDWWMYFFNSYMETSYRTWTWQRIKLHRKKYKDYVKVYKKKLKAVYQHDVNKTILDECLLMEEELDVANILIARRQAENEFLLEKESGLVEPAAKEPEGWLEWLGIKYEVVKEDHAEDDEKLLLLSGFNETEKNELYKAIGYVDGDTQHPVYSKEYVRSQVEIHLDTSSITLKRNADRNIINIELTKLLVSLTERPGSKGYGVDFGLEGLDLTNDDKSLVTANSKDHLRGSFAINPLDPLTDYSLKLDIKPIYVICDETLVHDVKDFFQVSNLSKLEELELAASDTMEGMSAASRAGLEYAITQNKGIYVNIKIASPVIMLPTKVQRWLYINLGDLSVTTNLQEELRKQSVRDATDQDLDTMFYYQIDLSLTNIGVSTKENVNFDNLPNEENILTLAAFDVHLQKSLRSGYTNFPDWKIACALPVVIIHLCEDTFILLLETITYFTNNVDYTQASSSKSHSSKSSQQRRRGSLMTKDKLLAIHDVLKPSTKPPSAKPPKKVEETFSEIDYFGDVFNKKQPYDEDLTLFNRTKVIAKFETQKVCIKYDIVVGEEAVRFEVLNLLYEFKDNVCDTFIQANLGCMDLLFVKGKERTEIFSSAKNDDLIKVEFQTTKSSGPQFKSRFNSTENSLTGQLGLLKVYLVGEIMTKVAFAMMQCYRRFSVVNEKSKSLKKKLPKISEEEEFDIEGKSSLDHVTDVVVAKVDMAAKLTFRGMLVKVENFSLLEITDVNLLTKHSLGATHISFVIRDVSLTDKRSGTRYPQILAVNSEKLLSFEVIFHNDVEATGVCPDLELSLNVGKMKCYAVYEFVACSLKFIYSLSNLPSIDATNGNAKVQITQKTSIATKTKLNLAIVAPDIYLPVSQTSTTCFFFNLGCIYISNTLRKDREALFEEISISVDDLAISYLDTALSSSPMQIILPIFIKAKLQRNLLALQHELLVSSQLQSFLVNFEETRVREAIFLFNAFLLLQTSTGSNTDTFDGTNSSNLKIKLDCDIAKVETSFFKSPEDLLFTISSENLRIAYESGSGETNVELHLKQLNLVRFTKDKQLTLLSSNDVDDVFNVTYTADSNTPSQDVSFSFGDLSILADDASIHVLVDNILKYTSSLSELRFGGNNEDKNHVKERPSNISGSLNSISLQWLNNGRSLAHTRLTGVVVSVTFTIDDMHIKLRLDSLLIEDSDEKAVYKTILRLHDDNLLTLQYSMKTIPTSEQTTFDREGCLWLRVGRVKVFFLYKFYIDFMCCINDVLDEIMLIFLSQYDKTATIKPSESSPQMFLNLDADISAPLVVFPEHSASNDFLLADLGRCVVSNMADTSSGNLKNIIKVNLSGMNTYLKLNDVEEKITEDLHAHVDVILPVLENETFFVNVIVATIAIRLTNDQLKLLASLFYINFNEKGSYVPLDGASDPTKHHDNETENLMEKQALRTYQINIECEAIVLCLSQTNLTECGVTSYQPLCDFAASSLKMKLFLDRETNLWLTVRSLSSDDNRTQSHVVKRILQKCNRQVSATSLNQQASLLQDPQLAVNYVTKGNIRNVHVETYNSMLFLNLGFLKELMDFLVQSFDLLESDKNNICDASGDKIAESHLRVDCQLRNFELILLEDYNVNITPAFIAQVQSTFNYNQSNDQWSFELKESTIGVLFGEYPALNHTCRPLLQPCSFKCKLSFCDVIDLQVSVKKMVFSLSPSILTFIIHVVDSISGHQIIEDLTPAQSQTEYVSWENKPISLEDVYGKANQEKSISLKTPPKERKEGQTLEKFHLVFDMIELTLGNDMQGIVVPLLTILISARAHVLDWSTKLSFDGEFTLEAKFFNETQGTWEPLIEPTLINNEALPYEMNIRMFYGKSEVLDFSVRPTDEMMHANIDKRSIMEEYEFIDGPIETPKDTLYVVIDSQDMIQVTVTSTTIELANQLLEAWSIEVLRNPLKTKILPPYQFVNQLGQAVTIYMGDPKKATVTGSKESVTIRRFHSLESEGEMDVTQNSHQEGVYLNPWLVDGNRKEYVDIQVEGFEVVRNICIQNAGHFVHKLTRLKNENEKHDLAVHIRLEKGRKIVSLTNIIQVVNRLNEKIYVHIYEEDIGPLLTIVDSSSETSLPMVQYQIRGICFKLEKFSHSKCMPLKNVNKPERMSLLELSRENEHRFVKVIYTRIFTNDKPPVEAYRILLIPPMQISNLLPIELSVIFELSGESSEYKVQPGETVDIMSINTRKSRLTITLQNVDSQGSMRSGRIHYDYSRRSEKIKMLKGTSEDECSLVEMRSVIVENVLRLQFYSAYWVINKTGLQLQYKNSKDNVYDMPDHQTTPLLPMYVKKKKEKGCIKVKGGDWSKDFILDIVGDESVVECTHGDGKIFSIYTSIQLARTGLTYMITFSPTHIITNSTEMAIEFCENKSSMEWRLLAPSKSSHIWLNSIDATIYIKEEFGAYVAPALPFDREYKCAKRLSSGVTVCVDVDRLGERCVMSLCPYEEGCIPVRVDNYCSNLPVFLKQRDTTSWTCVSSLAPSTSRFYTWKDLQEPYELCVSLNPVLEDCDVINPKQNDVGRITESNNTDKTQTVDSPSGHCCRCTFLPCCHDTSQSDTCCHDTSQSDGVGLLNDEYEPMNVFYATYLEGRQRVIAFTTTIDDLKKLYKRRNEECVGMEAFISLNGVGVSLVNSVPQEIAYVSITSGTSLWEVEIEGRWQALDMDLSTFLEDAWKNQVTHANYEKKIRANIENMTMTSPRAGNIRRTQEPAVWLQVTQSASNTSLHFTINRLQVDNQQYDVTFPAVLYPTPLSPRIIKRNGLKPFLEASVVFTSLHDTLVIKYAKMLLQEMNLKVDRDILTGLLSLYSANKLSPSEHHLFMQDLSSARESVASSLSVLRDTQSVKLLIDYLHLSPVKLHLSFSLESNVEGETSTEDDLFEWLVGVVGIHFTEISDVVIKLAYFERCNVSLSQEVLLAEASMHYALQAVKQFHVLVLGLDVLGNPYGLISEYGQGFKDLFYEPYLGSVRGPHDFAEGLVYGVKSLLGHTVGGTAGAASLITEQLGQVVAALSFDSEYKRQRHRHMSSDPSGIGEGLAIGGKQFVLGIIFGVSGLITKPVQGARKSGVEGFFKGVGKGILGLLVKPTGGVIDLVTSSLDGVRRFAEQGGHDIVCRIRLPRVTIPNKPVSVYSSVSSYGSGLLRTLQSKQAISGCYTDHVAVPDKRPRVVIFTTEVLVEATQNKFFEEWKVERATSYGFVDSATTSKLGVYVLLKPPTGKSEQMENSLLIACANQIVVKILVEKINRFVKCVK